MADQTLLTRPYLTHGKNGEHIRLFSKPFANNLYSLDLDITKCRIIAFPNACEKPLNNFLITSP
ncbi:MAG TPA: hypothetical protein VE226_05865 [Nitrososphaeraceae archaeon]|nr:hypothetical protein [Nitrososphaeraceae archaeon]